MQKTARVTHHFTSPLLHSLGKEVTCNLIGAVVTWRMSLKLWSLRLTPPEYQGVETKVGKLWFRAGGLGSRHTNKANRWVSRKKVDWNEAGQKSYKSDLASLHICESSNFSGFAVWILSPRCRWIWMPLSTWQGCRTTTLLPREFLIAQLFWLRFFSAVPNIS